LQKTKKCYMIALFVENHIIDNAAVDN